MAFVGTTLNTAVVAFGLYYIFAELMWEKMNIFHAATFASIISGDFQQGPHSDKSPDIIFSSQPLIL